MTGLEDQFQLATTRNAIVAERGEVRGSTPAMVKVPGFMVVTPVAGTAFAPACCSSHSERTGN